jgi:hypothetical protein
MYLNMLQDTIMLSPLNEDVEYLAYFQQDRFTSSLWYLHAQMVVPELVAVVLLSGLQGPQTSAHLMFTSGVT